MFPPLEVAVQIAMRYGSTFPREEKAGIVAKNYKIIWSSISLTKIINSKIIVVKTVHFTS